METIALNARSRTTTGKNAARALRRTGWMPAVLYGPGIESRMLSVPIVELENALKTGSAARMLLNVIIDDDRSDSHPAMIRELRSNPLDRHLLHVDLYRFAHDRKIAVPVPVVTTGTAAGVEMGGMLQIIRHEVEVLVLPGRIPEQITIDVSALNIGDSVHVAEITLDEGVELPTDVNFTVLTVLGKKLESGETPADEAAAAEPVEGGADGSAEA